MVMVEPTARSNRPMKTPLFITLGLGLAAAMSLATNLAAQGTSFTYQGRFNTNNAPYTGPAEFQFTLWDAVSGGNAVAANNPASVIVPVTDGLFTATLDFGSNPFNGQPRFLQIEARTAIGPFTLLSPRQPLTPTPYALRALNLTTNGLTAGTYASAVTLNNANNNFSGAFIGNGANVTNVNAATLGGLSAAGFWKTGGNAGTTSGSSFLGTTDNQPLELMVNGRRALRLEPTANDATHSNMVNVIGGSPANYVSNGVCGATISGGGAVIYGGVPLRGNSVSRDFGTVGGGAINDATGFASTVGGGYQNTASGDGAMVPGGKRCTASGFGSFAAGYHATALHDGAFVWADSVSVLEFASTAADQFLIRAAGGVGIGLNNPASPLHVSSAGSNPQLRLTQTTSGEYARLRMNVNGWPGSPFWEMDASPGATPSLSWWNVSQRMVLDYSGNLTTSGTVNGTSDRNAKEKFTTISSRAVLEKVVALPISEWNFKNESAIRHIGPMAQDFYAAFNVGMDDKHIATVDEGGVALTAIQGLNEKVEAGSQRSEAGSWRRNWNRRKRR